MTAYSKTLTAALACALLSVGAAARDVPAARVLFIGNSLTYVNNMPAMIEAIAAQAGLKGRVTCRAVAKPDYGLQQHWDEGEEGDARRAIANGTQWTHIVLQQGPSSQLDSRAVLRDYTKKFTFEAQRAGARVVIYSPWTPRTRLAFMDAVLEAHRLAAEDAGGMLVPVGEGWRAAWRRDPSLPLYGADGFHPSPIGTYLGALMFFERFSGRSPVGLPNPSESKDKSLRDVTVDAAQLKVLQESAAEANSKAAAHPTKG